MAHITTSDAQGWAESTKLTLSSLDASLEAQISTEVLSRLASAYDISGWTNDTNTPALVKVIIAKMYVAWFYDKSYSENQDQGNDYAAMLRTNAEMLITGIIDGVIDVPGVPGIGTGVPGYYPNDASSALEPTFDDPSLGPAKFSMGKVF
ncbi:MAG TPA: hypothetical protein V6C65_19265 [Allocoleopsis sp.]